MNFLSDIFDLGNTKEGEVYLAIRDSVIIPRGASLTRILVASLTGALPNSRADSVNGTLYKLIVLAFGLCALYIPDHLRTTNNKSLVTDTGYLCTISTDSSIWCQSS